MSKFDFLKEVDVIDEVHEHCIYVQWADHYSGNHSWTPIDGIIEKHESNSVYNCVTCGFLIYEDDYSIKIALSVNDSRELASAFTIVKSTIIERLDFKAWPNEKKIRTSVFDTDNTSLKK